MHVIGALIGWRSLRVMQGLASIDHILGLKQICKLLRKYWSSLKVRRPVVRFSRIQIMALCCSSIAIIIKKGCTWVTLIYTNKRCCWFRFANLCELDMDPKSSLLFPNLVHYRLLQSWIGLKKPLQILQRVAISLTWLTRQCPLEKNAYGSI